jgi:hypothetical protein
MADDDDRGKEGRKEGIIARSKEVSSSQTHSEY